MENGEIPRDRKAFEIGRVITDTFALMGNQAFIVFTVAAIVILPSRMFLISIPYLVTELKVTSMPSAVSISAIPAALIVIIMAIFGQGALIGAVLTHRRGGKPKLRETLFPALKRFPAIAAVAMLACLGECVGLLFLIVPGVIATLIWLVAGPTLIAERTSVVGAFRRSETLTDDLLGRIFLLLLVAGLGLVAYWFIAQFLGRLAFDTGSDALDYPFTPGPFLFSTLTKLLSTAFGLSLNCTLYAVLVEARGDGPMREHLTHIFE